MTTRRLPESKLALWRRRSHEVLTSGVVTSTNPGPPPTPGWAVAAKQPTNNTNHFCKVFRHLQHLSPATYRRTIG